MKGLFLIVFLLLAGRLLAQEVPAATEQQLENLGEETIKDDALLQQLVFLRSHPLNLNSAREEELAALPMLTALQIGQLLRHRELFGPLLSVYELQAIPGFDLLTIHTMLPYVFTGEVQHTAETLATRLKSGSRLVLFRWARVLEKAKGYNTAVRTHYLGSADRLQVRYSFQYKTLLSYGLVADKDAGEQFFRGAQKAGFDFYSVHFFVRNLGKLKALALGDYTINLGQGLTQWQSLAFGKSADVMAVKRQSPVLLPYRSAGEFLFNRGMAATMQWRRWEATAFLSYKKFSGNLQNDSDERFTSFGTSGYYRTPAEIADRYKLSDWSAGGNLSFNRSNFHVGINAVMHRFSLPLQKSALPYNRFALSGNQFFWGSIDYSLSCQNAHFFGEAATDGLFHLAFLQGVLVSVDPKLDLSFLYRDLSKKYTAPFGNAFTESSLPSNERGWYTGAQFRPSAAWQVMVYVDVFRFPFLRYRASAPSRGSANLVQLSYTPRKDRQIYLRYRLGKKQQDTAGTVLPWLLVQRQQNLRLQFSAAFPSGLTLQCRLEKNWFNGSRPESGLLVFSETGFAASAKWSGHFRLQYFTTGSYDTRLYAYESDLPYSFSIPAFFDEGFRYYFVFSWRPAKKISVGIRLAQTIFRNKARVGSGLDEIAGNRKTEAKAAVIYRF